MLRFGGGGVVVNAAHVGLGALAVIVVGIVAIESIVRFIRLILLRFIILGLFFIGFGLVYLAHDDQLSRSVAIKVPHPKLVETSDGEAYIAEARTVANLDHPNIVPVFDVGCEHGQHYLSMAFVEGKSLSARIRHSGCLSPSESANLTRAQILVQSGTNVLSLANQNPQNVLSLLR